MQRSLFLFKQLIQLLLIVHIGIIGPLVYLKPYSPHDVGPPTYQLSIFQDTSQITKLAELRQLLHQANHPLLPTVNHSDYHPVINDSVSVPSWSIILQSLLSHILTWPGSVNLNLPPHPFFTPTDNTLLIYGVDLPLPEKPPSSI